MMSSESKRGANGSRGDGRPELASRAALRKARRVLIKAGTSIVSNEDGRPSLTRMGAIVEQISELTRDCGIEVLFVSSGAVTSGKQLLRKQDRMNMKFSDLLGGSRSSGAPPRRQDSFASLVHMDRIPHTLSTRDSIYDSACAAAGQFEMMNLYSSLFARCDVSAAQILLTQDDFVVDPIRDKSTPRLENLRYAIERLLKAGMVPILNENDAVSANRGYTPDDLFSDNDSLAALCCRSFGVEVCVLLTDVEGVYDRPPTEPGAVRLPCFLPSASDKIKIGAKSAQGRGGMAAKIEAASAAVAPGSTCGACLVASGKDLGTIRSLLHPSYTPDPDEMPRGTLFATPGSQLEALALKELEEQQKQQQRNHASSQTSSSLSSSLSPSSTTTGSPEHTAKDEARRMAVAARREARILAAMDHKSRGRVLNAVADALLEHSSSILEANRLDLEAAETSGLTGPLLKRLKLTDAKLATLADGLRSIASSPKDPLNRTVERRELSDGLELRRTTVPIGVVLVVFESRPDCLPQIAGLSLASGNGLLLKGGKEALKSNEALHRVVVDAVYDATEGKVGRGVIGLITTRSQVSDLLGLDGGAIDLVVPRGGNALVSHIQQHTKIPVLGHADGVCHVYVDESATPERAVAVVVDAKTDYPSACNAMETLLLHRNCLASSAASGGGVAAAVLTALRASGVKCLGAPRAMAAGLCDLPAVPANHHEGDAATVTTTTAPPSYRVEYGDHTCTIEVVDSVDDAIDWIHRHGSGHTEAIVCDSSSSDVAKEFLHRVDAACVFCNASTRFADGYRFGLGAEVGISTGRIHARGPVGVEGLLTTKWQLRSTDGTVHRVSDYGGDAPTRTYTHRDLDLDLETETETNGN